MTNEYPHLPPRIHLGYLPDETVIAYLQGARVSIRFVGPGLPEPVAKELSRLWKRLGAAAVEVVIDADAELCRIGYCDGAALGFLLSTATELHANVHRQAGIRLCVLEIDGERIIFAPTPRLVEESNAAAAQVQLSPSQGESLQMQILAPPKLTPLSVTQADVDKVNKNLELSPPQPFDLARQVHVLSTQFQFVEFSLTGAALARKRIPVPPDLLGLATDPDTKELLHASFQLILKDDEVSGEPLIKWRNEIEKRYLKTIANFGKVILNTDREAFDKAVKKLREEVDKFREKAEVKLDEAIKKNCSQVVEQLLPKVLATPPERWTPFRGDRPLVEDFRRLLAEDLQSAYGDARNHLGKIEVRVIFKNITVEMLHDQDFLAAAQRSGLHLKGKTEEFVAAKARV